MSQQRVSILGVGMAVPGYDGVPGRRVSNEIFAAEMWNRGNMIADAQGLTGEARDTFMRAFETSDEWIAGRTGIRERCFADKAMATSDLATIAGRRALESARLPARMVERVDLATVTPDHLATPPTVALVAANLGLGRSSDGARQSLFGADTSVACSSFLAALQNSYASVASGLTENALTIGADVMSRIVNQMDRSFSVIFGDAAAALVLGPTVAGKWGSFDPDLFTFGMDGRYADRIIVRAGGSRCPTTLEGLERGDHQIWMDGPAVFKEVVSMVYSHRDPMHSIIGRGLFRAKKRFVDIHVFFFHQANLRMIRAIETELRKSDYRGQIYINVDRFGNTTSASVPLLMADAHACGELRKGMTFMAVAFGGGYTWGTAVGRWTVANPH